MAPSASEIKLFLFWCEKHCVEKNSEEYATTPDDLQTNY